MYLYKAMVTLLLNKEQVVLWRKHVILAKVLKLLKDLKGFHNFTTFLNTATRVSPDMTFDDYAKNGNLDDSFNVSYWALLGGRVWGPHGK